MKGKEVLEALKRKFNVSTDSGLAKMAGVSVPTIQKWKSNNESLTPRQMANLVYTTATHRSNECLIESIKPLVEYYPIDHADSKHGANVEILPTNTARNKKIRQQLDESKGIYVFYNSQCRAIYLGKAKKQDLWKEMNLAFNRVRKSQQIWRVLHPDSGQGFEPAYQRQRPIRKCNVYLCDIAFYFSAYRVDVSLINNVEAIMIRAFANELTNVRIETFKK